MGLRDRFSRPLRDLRISVTDRCNLRCVYCMPREVFGPNYRFLDRGEILSFEEIARVAGIVMKLGVQKVRLTGGEPLVRRNIERLVEMLSQVGDLDLSMTTNGAALAAKAQALRQAGLKRVTVSLDSLDEPTFRSMTDSRLSVQTVLDAIDAAAAAGLLPVKVNMVVKRGVNESSVVAMARHFRGTGHIVRFIEYMDVGGTNGWIRERVVRAKEIIEMIDAEMPLEPLDGNYRGEVARRYRYRAGGGEIGVIASVSEPFCGDCTRARLSSDGKLYTCLFASSGYDIRALLRGGASDDEVAAAIRAAWSGRADRYSELRSAQRTAFDKPEMSYIGG